MQLMVVFILLLGVASPMNDEGVCLSVLLFVFFYLFYICLKLGLK